MGQHAHSNLTMKQIVARLVKVRKEEMNKKRNRSMDTLQQQQMHDMKKQVKFE